MINEPRWLSTGPRAGARVAGAVFSLAFAAFGALFAAGVLVLNEPAADCVPDADVAGIPPEALPDGLALCRPWNLGQLGAAEIAGLLAGGAFVVLGLLLAVSAVRGTAAWLDGTTLRVRSAFRTRAVDLSTADVTAGVVTHSRTGEGRTTTRRIPTLEARDPASGRTVTLALQGATMDRLPPAELRALADAITAGRSEPEAADVAQQLRRMADNPLELPG